MGGYSLLEYLKMVFAGENPYAFHLWYLWVLFLITLIAFTVFKIGDALKLNSVILFICVGFLLWNLRLMISSDNIMLIKAILKHTIYFAFGIVLTTVEINVGSIQYKLVSAASWLFALCRITGIVRSRDVVSGYLLNLLILVSVTVIITNIFNLSKRIESRFLKYVGENSLWFYLFHQPFFCALLGMIVYDKLGFSIFVSCVICVIASFGAVFLLNYLVDCVPIIKKARQLLFE